MEEKPVILIVDDIELNRAILCELFRAHYCTVEAENGFQAMEKIRIYGDRIAVVLLDIVMPVMGGIEVLREMDREGWMRSVPVVIITAESGGETVQLAYDLGAADVIDKPFHPVIIWKRVSNVIALHRYKRQTDAVVHEQLAEMEAQAQMREEANAFVIEAFGTAAEFRGSGPGPHILRIQAVTRLLMEAVSARFAEYYLPPMAIDRIVGAAALHDLGKSAISDSILLKPGRLTPDEFAIMKTHTTRGCDLLNGLRAARDGEYYRYAYDICRSHHERWDGSGYPDGLKRDEIPIWAQVTALADAYVALVGERPQRPAYAHKDAARMLVDGACGAFNPQLIRCFVEIEEDLWGAVRAAKPQPPRRAGASKASHQEKAISDRTLWLLELEREKYHILSELSGDIVFDYDEKTDILQFSEKYMQVFGGSFQIPDARRYLQQTQAISGEDKTLLHAHLRGLAPARSTDRLELKIRTAAGKMEWFCIHMHALWKTALQPERVGVIGKLTNIHQERTEAERLRERANADALTGILNREAFEETVTTDLASGQLSDGALFFIDVDNFKTVNDTQGHLIGDQVLRCLSRHLKALFRATDAVGRIGGDEFAVFLRNLGNVENIEARARKICGVFAIITQEIGCGLALSGSVGVSRYPQDGVSYRELLDKADKSLYYAKNAGKNRHALYSPKVEGWKFHSVLSEVEQSR